MGCPAKAFGCGCEECRAYKPMPADADWRIFRALTWVLIVLFIALGGIGFVKATERVNNAYQEDV